MKENPYLKHNYQLLKAMECILQDDCKDSTLTNKERANAKTKLQLVREALKTK